MYKCKECNEQFDKSRELGIHVWKMHHPHIRKTKVTICAWCNKSFTQFSSSKKIYCCLGCGTSAYMERKYKQYITEWLAGKHDGMKGKTAISAHIKRWLREKFVNKCSKCGWHEINPVTGLVPLEVEHKDGNSENNVPDNLDLICPNCHSLTPTYRSLNKGRGREHRIYWKAKPN